ncbi:MAG TPA: amidase, partial [Methyloceanibacter sp.]|nr:amidase [Methyloceanibacter sp.]
MSWKTAYRSFYYDGAPEPADPVLQKGKVALLVIDVQNTYLDRPDPATLKGDALKRY